LEALRKQVLYYKTRYERIVEEKQYVDGIRITREDALEFVIGKMMQVEDTYMMVNQKPAASWKSF